MRHITFQTGSRLARRLDRRTFLRGAALASASVAIPLPRLPMMLDDGGTAYAAGEPLAKLFGVWFHGVGNVPVRWNPAKTGQGTAWTLSEQMAPLAPVKSHLTAITGMKVRGNGTIHINGTAGILTGAPHAGDHTVRAPSIDQVIAGLVSHGAPFKSLEVGVCRATANAPTNGTCWNFISHTGPNAPNRPEYDARVVFQRIFGKAPGGGEPSAAASEAKLRKSILDLVTEDARALKGIVGAEDARRLDQHLEGIYELEKRIGALPAAAACSLPADAATKYPNVLPDNNATVPPELNTAMAELVVYALSCDLARVFSFQWSRPAAHVYFPFFPAREDFHDDIQHKETGDQPRVSMAVVYTIGHLNVLAEKMKATPHGAGNLLDASCVLATSDNGLGRAHSVEDFPILLLGKAGGALKGDLHISARGDNPTKVLLTLANIYGANRTTFGLDACEANQELAGLRSS